MQDEAVVTVIRISLLVVYTYVIYLIGRYGSNKNSDVIKDLRSAIHLIQKSEYQKAKSTIAYVIYYIEKAESVAGYPFSFSDKNIKKDK